MNMERQNTFGWLVSLDVFLGGAGSGVFLFSFILDLLNKCPPLARIGAIAGLVLVVIGAALLYFDLNNKTKFYRLIYKPSSWISRGTWCIIVFVIFGLAYSLPPFWARGVVATMPFIAIGGIAAVFAVLVMLYTGFLLGAAKRVPLWNTSALPLLFFFSSLYTGMAVLLLLAVSFGVSQSETVRALVIAEFVLILIQILVLTVFLGMAYYGSTTAVESVQLLIKSPSFIVIVIIGGLVIPLGLLGYQALTTNALVLSIFASIFVLIGGLFLRHGILRAGIRLPIYSH